MHSVLTIGEVAKRSGVAASALRYYEERGLLLSFREPGKQRRYPRAVLRTIAFIVFAQRIGLSLDDIRAELAKLPGGKPPSRADWHRISKTWQATIDTRIAELQRLRGSLTDCIGCGCLSLDKCHLTNPADRIAKNGAGARFWIGDRRR